MKEDRTTGPVMMLSDRHQYTSLVRHQQQHVWQRVSAVVHDDPVLLLQWSFCFATAYTDQLLVA